MTTPIKTLLVPHLGGIHVGHRVSASLLDPAKPTLVLFNPFTTTADYFLPQFQDKALTDALNLVAIEPLGHGKTQLKKTESFTHWDSAIMSLQLLDILGIDKDFTSGTSQGGWIATRMALLASDRVWASIFQTVKGVIPIGSSMDFESPRSRELGCWDGPEACSGLVGIAGDPAPAHDFESGDAYCDFLMKIGYGVAVTPEIRDFWAESLKKNYSGDEGKRRICMAAVCLAGRGGLRERLTYIRCPVLWFQGTDDVVFSVRQAKEDMKLFTNSATIKLVTCKGSVHFLGSTHGETIQRELLEFISTWNKGGSLYFETLSRGGQPRVEKRGPHKVQGF
uniref:AB hydrolase-1 domain-containing protein n=1 Tax=Bionectria ochroleuca TaxID=29856 RepID=A0A8H7K5Y0_BIOOC